MPAQEFSIRQLQPFLDSNPGRGTLRVQVSTASGTLPVSQALVEVAVILNGGRIPLYRRRTDSSGIADGFVLPARPFADSQSPGTASGSAIGYAVSIHHPAYLSVADLAADVFIDTNSILPVALTPITV